MAGATTPGTALATMSMDERKHRPAGGIATIEEHPDWALLQRIPMRVEAAIPLPGLRVRDLVGLKPGLVVPSAWPSTDDVPLMIGAVQLSWSEFEVVDERIAIRLTRLA